MLRQDGLQPLLAQECRGLVSALPVLLFLLHAPDHQKGDEVNPQLGAKKLLKCLKTLRLHPVLPLIGTLPFCTTDLLLASPALCAQGRSLEPLWAYGFHKTLHSTKIPNALLCKSSQSSPALAWLNLQ